MIRMIQRIPMDEPPFSLPRQRQSLSAGYGRRVYERTFANTYPLELGLAVAVPWKKARRRQRPLAGGLHEKRATPSAPVWTFTTREKTQPSSRRKRLMRSCNLPAAAGVTRTSTLAA